MLNGTNTLPPQSQCYSQKELKGSAILDPCQNNQVCLFLVQMHSTNSNDVVKILLKVSKFLNVLGKAMEIDLMFPPWLIILEMWVKQ